MVVVQLAYAKKEKTVTFKDGVLTDTIFHFSMQVPEIWKVRSFNEPSVERAFLEKKNYSINRKVQTYGGDYTIPTVIIFAQEFNGAAGDFEALLKKSMDEHRSDNEIISKLGILRDSDFIIAGDVIIDSLQGRLVLLKRNYKRVLAKDAYGRSPSPVQESEEVINDHEVHELFLVKKGDVLYVIQAYSEREFYPENKIDFDPLILSIKLQG
jgi:hypothetical protein